MTALIVIGAILLVLFILLASSITAELEFDGTFRYKVKYLFFTFIVNPESPRRKRKREKKEQKKKKKEAAKAAKEAKNAKKAAKQKKTPAKKKAETAVVKPQEEIKTEKAEEAPAEKKSGKKEEKAEKKAEKPKMKFSLDLIQRIIGRASPHVKRIFKKIRFYNVVIFVTAGGKDAAKVAMSYGYHCWAVYSITKLLSETITFKAKDVDVRADFDLEKNEYYLYGVVKMRVSTLLHSAIWGFFAVLSEIRKDSKPAPKAQPQKKAA